MGSQALWFRRIKVGERGLKIVTHGGKKMEELNAEDEKGELHRKNENRRKRTQREFKSETVLNVIGQEAISVQ